ncbi:MAG: hypothetical protein ABIQ95_16280 [Bdellovibrionia bacterium]
MRSPAGPSTIQDTLERIQVTLNFSPEEFLSILELNQRDYDQVLSGERAVSSSLISRLAEQLDLCPNNILSGKIDFKALSAHFSGNPTLLPERYAFAALSRRRTSIHLLNTIELNYGWRTRERIIRQLQVNESILSSPDAPISMRFPLDLFEIIQTLDRRKNVIFEMGRGYVSTNYYSKLGELYRGLSSPKKLYERTFPYLASIYYETNTIYRLMKLSDSHCVIEATPNPQLIEAFKTKFIGSLGACQQKLGAFASLPLYHSLPLAKIHETACIHKGDPSCLFHVDFEIPTQIKKLRRKSKSRTLAS